MKMKYEKYLFILDAELTAIYSNLATYLIRVDSLRIPFS